MEKIEIKGLKETIYTDTCKNGLKVYVWVNEKVKSTFMSLSVKFGSINTEFSYNGTDIQVPNGTAHFLEHVKFNEKDGSTAHDYFKKLGSDVNAFTTFEYTSYIVLN
jgi:predicted Zn-dependent peptidase